MTFTARDTSDSTGPQSHSREAEAVADRGEASVCDDNFVLVQEDVAGVQSFVHDAAGMQVAHPRGNLLGDADALLLREGLGPGVEVLVESVTTAVAVRGEGCG